MSVRLEFDKNGVPLAKPRMEEFGSSLSSVDEVEDRVRRAQKVALNPSMSPSEILITSKLSEIVDECKFTSNVVCVQITGKGVGNLTLTDLPGLI